MKRFRWDKKYLYWGVTAFLVIIASIVFFLLVSNLSWLRNVLRNLGAILSPFVWGLVIAYLLYPVMNLYSRCLFTPLCSLLFKKSKRAEERIPKAARGLSVFLSIITLLFLITGLIWLVVPQIYSSLESIAANSAEYITRVDDWLSGLLKDYPEIAERIGSVVGDLSSGVVNWVSSMLLPRMGDLISSITANVINVVQGIYNILIGIIVSVYVLYSREVFSAHGKKLLYCIFSLEASEKLLNGAQFVNEVFMGFISGKILDSLIVGVICYIGCALMRLPYPLLLAFLIGLFNIIPFFGPIIGAIPTALIVLTDSPWKMLIFLIFVVVLQQFDGNILGPKILGNRVGVNGFWIMFAIILGAGLFGFAGMLLGVPVFVVIYAFFSSLVKRKLARSGLPTETEAYKGLGYFDPKTGQPMAWEETSDETTTGRRRKRRTRLGKKEKDVNGDDAPKA